LPIVVLESGLGDGKESWHRVFEPVSEFARVLAYDRGGYGRSTAQNESRETRNGATIFSAMRRIAWSRRFDR
jgi:pimeloyl-ACP methyl ester carboxylesterase